MPAPPPNPRAQSASSGHGFAVLELRAGPSAARKIVRQRSGPTRQQESAAPEEREFWSSAPRASFRVLLARHRTSNARRIRPRRALAPRLAPNLEKILPWFARLELP